MADVDHPRPTGLPTGRAALDSLASAVVILDPAGDVLLWNEAAEALTGWPEREVLGRSAVDVLAPGDHRDRGLEDLALVRDGYAITGDRVVARRDGEIRRVLVSARPVSDEHDAVVAIVASLDDVTDLRRAEQRARDLNQHFRLALDAGGLGTWRWDRASGATVWDDRLEAMFGLPAGGFDGTFDTYVALLHPDDRDRVLAVVDDALTSKSSYKVEHRVVWRDGSIRWIGGAGAVTTDEHGAVTGTVGCAMDVTDRVEAELEGRRLAAIAVEAAEQERTQRERLEFLSRINDAINVATTVEDIMANVTRAAVPRLGDWCAVHLLRPGGALVPDVEIAHVDPAMVEYAHELRERFPYDPEATSGVPAVIRTGETQFFPEIDEDAMARLELTEEMRQVVDQLALRSSIAVPIGSRDKVLGAVQFVMSSSSRRYTVDDVALAEWVAGRIATSVENIRLHDQQRLIAETLQRSLLPAALPDVPGIELAVRYWAAGEANEVGGDFYDVFALDADGRWAAVIGDVCGTGAGAAALTGLARHSIRAAAWHGDRPDQVLDALNRAVTRSGTETFLTCVYAVVDTSRRDLELSVTSGGHPLPIHVGARGASALGSPGRLLGMFDGADVNTVTAKLQPGDVVVFYTDGVTDVTPPYALEESDVLALVERAVAPGGPAEAIADRIHVALSTILSFEHRDDDIALLVLRVTAG